MRNINIAFFGHSYIRDLKLLYKENINDSEFRLNFNYFFKPGLTVGRCLSNQGFLEALLLSSPDIVFIFLGGNDLRIDINIHDTIFNYKNLVTLIVERLPEACVICSYIEPRFAPASDRFNTPPPIVYKALARKFNNWLNRWDIPHKKFLTWGSNRLQNKLLFRRDLVHLNSIGLNLLWNLIIDILLKVIRLKYGNNE